MRLTGWAPEVGSAPELETKQTFGPGVLDHSSSDVDDADGAGRRAFPFSGLDNEGSVGGAWEV